MKKLIITEQDKNHIKSLYGLLNEETEPDLKKNHDPYKQPSVKRLNCDPFCQFDAEEVKVIQKCFTASQFIGYTQMDKNQTKEDKEETISLTLGACASKGTITQDNAKYLSTKFKNIFFNTWSPPTSIKAPQTKEEKEKFACDTRKNQLNFRTPSFSELDKIFFSGQNNTCDYQIINLLYKKLEFIKKESSSYLKEASKFYLDYFDYNKKPEILDKIRNIHIKNEKVRPIDPKEEKSQYKERQLNPSAPGEYYVKMIIDDLKKNCLDKIYVKLNFFYCLTSRSTLAWVSDEEPYQLNVCPLKFLNFDWENNAYLFKRNSEDLKTTIIHEFGHLVDFYFKKWGINLYISNSEKSKNPNVSSEYPHSNSPDNIFTLIDIEPNEKYKNYTVDDSEQYARYKILYNYLISEGYDIRMFNNKQYFQNFFGKLFENKKIEFVSEGYLVEDYTYQNGILEFYSKDINTVQAYSADDIHEISFLFSNIGTYIKEKMSASSVYLYKVKFDINKLFEDMNENYVELMTTKRVGSDVA
jgi:hypothetical protein